MNQKFAGVRARWAFAVAICVAALIASSAQGAASDAQQETAGDATTATGGREPGEARPSDVDEVREEHGQLVADAVEEVPEAAGVESGRVVLRPEDVGGEDTAGGWSRGHAPTSITSAGSGSAWSAMDFGSAGVLRWKLVGRAGGASTTISEDGAISIEHGEQVALPAIDQLVVATASGLEEFVRVTPESTADASVSYQLVLPEGAYIEASPDGAWIFTADHEPLTRIEAPKGEVVASGETFDNTIAVEGSTLTVTPEAPNELVGEEVVIDPIFQAGPWGQYWRSYCALTCAPSGVVANDQLQVSSNTSPAFIFHSNSTNGLGVQAPSTSLAVGAQGLVYYTNPIPSETSIDAAVSHIQLADTTGKFQCRVEIGTTSSASSWSAWAGTGGNYASAYTNDTETVDETALWAGLKLKNNVGTTTPTSGGTKCTTNSGGDYLSILLDDKNAPTTSVVTSNVTEASVTAPWDMVWSGPNRLPSFTFSAQDNGSGIHHLGGATGYHDVNGNMVQLWGTNTTACTPNGTAVRPCPTTATHTVTPSAASFGGYSGTYIFEPESHDFAGNQDWPDGYLFGYDDDSPTGAFIDMPEYISMAHAYGSTFWVQAHIVDPPASPEEASGVATWSITVNPPAGASYVLCSGTEDDLDANNDVDCAFDVEHSPEGTYWMSMTIVDRAANSTTVGRWMSVDRTPPPTPTTSITQPTNSPVTHTWGGSTPPSGSPLANYYVCFGVTAHTCDDFSNFAIKPVTPTSWSGFQPPRDYYGRVYAVDRAGNWSAPSNQAQATVLPVSPNAPGTPAVTMTAGALAYLSWPASTPTTSGQVTVQGYEICAGATSTYCNDTTKYNHWRSEFAATHLELPSGTYWARVRAVDETGRKSAASAAVTFSVDATPPTVSAAVSTDSLRYDGRGTLTATAADASGVSKVTFQKRTADGTWSTIVDDTVAPFETYYNATTFVTDGQHEVRAVAYDAQGINTAISSSSPVCLDRALLEQPRNVEHKLSGGPAGAADVWWDAPSNETGIAGYVVYRSAAGSSVWTAAARVGRSTRAVQIVGVSGTDRLSVESVGQRCTTKRLQETFITSSTNTTTSLTNSTMGTSVDGPTITVTGDGARGVFIDAWGDLDPGTGSYPQIKQVGVGSVKNGVTQTQQAPFQLRHYEPPFTGTKTFVLGLQNSAGGTARIIGGLWYEHGIRAEFAHTVPTGGFVPANSVVNNSGAAGGTRVDVDTMTVTGDGRNSMLIEAWGAYAAAGMNGGLQITDGAGAVLQDGATLSTNSNYLVQYVQPPFTGTKTFKTMLYKGNAGGTNSIQGGALKDRGLVARWVLPTRDAGISTNSSSNVVNSSTATWQRQFGSEVTVQGDGVNSVTIDAWARHELLTGGPGAMEIVDAATGTPLQTGYQASGIVPSAIRYVQPPFTGTKTFRVALLKSAATGTSNLFGNTNNQRGIRATWNGPRASTLNAAATPPSTNPSASAMIGDEAHWTYQSEPLGAGVNRPGFPGGSDGRIPDLPEGTYDHG